MALIHMEPGPTDTAHARAHGVTPGGAIMIHGIRNGLGWIGKLYLLRNRIDGCVAVTNPEMDETWRAVPAGRPVEIVP